MWHQKGGQCFFLVSFNEHCAVAVIRSFLIHFVEKHGLADTSKPRQEQAFFRAFLPHPSQKNLLQDGLNLAKAEISAK